MKLSPDDLQSFLPFFMDEEYPKGREHPDRGHAIVHICHFILWLKEHVKEKKS